MKRCSPWPAPFSPQAPPKIALLCSPGSSILWRGPTPPERARLPWGFAPSQTGLAPFGPRRSRGLPVLVHVVSQRARGLRLRRTDCSLAMSRTIVLPSSIRRESASWFCVFRSSIPGPPIPLSTLQVTTHDATCKTRGQDGVAVSFLVGLFHSLQHAGLTRRTLINAQSLTTPALSRVFSLLY